MQLLNNQLHHQMEQLATAQSLDHFKEYLQSILEDTTTPYYQRADYIGLALQELTTKIDTLTNHIQEVQQLKKRLSRSLALAKEVTASIFTNNGIDRIDGNIISSLTLTPSSTKTQTKLTVTDSEALMQLGYIKYDIDSEAIEQTLSTKEGEEELKSYASLTSTTTTTPAKVKVNLKRSSAHQADKRIELVDSAA
jgi:prefoldin subunit 5